MSTLAAILLCLGAISVKRTGRAAYWASGLYRERTSGSVPMDFIETLGDASASGCFPTPISLWMTSSGQITGNSAAVDPGPGEDTFYLHVSSAYHRITPDIRAGLQPSDESVYGAK